MCKNKQKGSCENNDIEYIWQHENVEMNSTKNTELRTLKPLTQSV